MWIEVFLIIRILIILNNIIEGMASKKAAEKENPMRDIRI